VGGSNRTFQTGVRGPVSFLLTALLLASGLVGSLLERGYTAGDLHIEVPNGAAADHPGQHDHGLCALLATTHGLPGSAPAPALASAHTSHALPVHAGIILPQFTFTSLHSRAPPTH
jgi:hypothetical protein